MKKTFDPSQLRPICWEAFIYWEKFDKNVRIEVQPVVREVEDFQIRYINDFLNWDPSIYDRLEDPIFNYYEAMCRAVGLDPFIKSKKNVWSWINPGVVIVPAYSNGMNNYMSFELNCQWEA